MGSGSSCYPLKEHRESIDPEPYDTRRLLSELITVQTAIVLSDDIGDHSGSLTSPSRRRSLEYTITTSLTVPTATVSSRGRNDLGQQSGLESQGGALTDFMTAHFKQRVDLVKRDDGLMPCIQEISEVSTC